jgi:superfamily II DNA or RNA helicase
VESVEIYEPGSNDESFKSVISDKERDQGYIELYDFEVEDAHEYFAEGILVHNCHHVSSMQTQYAKALQALNAPCKFGLTGTLPRDDKGKMALEACIGPVIKDFDVNDGIAAGVLAKPRLRIIEAPDVPEHILYSEESIDPPQKYENDPYWKPTAYQVVYWNAIVKHVNRNMLILYETEKAVKKGESVLISVVMIEHVKELKAMADELFPSLGVRAVYGGTLTGDRDQIKKDFENKKVKAVIASTVWSEGTNIPSLNCCILGGGGKSPIKLLQNIGRGMRISKGKSHFTIIDFDDISHKYLINHSSERYKTYENLGWV